jgi:serine phosphatase RsbU (regulator of sigma subunit)
VTAKLPILLALIVLMLWGVVVLVRRRSRAGAQTGGGSSLALTELAERSLDLESLSDVLAASADAARVALSAKRVVAFEPGAREGAWDASEPGAGAIDEVAGGPEPASPVGGAARARSRPSIDAVPDGARGVFAWFKHNTTPILIDEIGDARYGAMRVPLAELGRRYQLDVIVPLVDRGLTIGALGLGIGRKLSRAERDLLGELRQQVTAAAANVRLHREAAHKLTLEKEVDLASAVQQTLVPASSEGRVGRLVWTGHYRPAGQVGSDFWSAYDLGNDRVLLVIGDVVGTGLAGSMASAVAKSCCDALHAAGAAGDVVDVLAALNRALFRPMRPIHMTCFAAVIDARRGNVTYANAGHELPYHASVSGALGVLGGSGPMLGDGPDARWQRSSRPLAHGDTLLLFTDGLSEAMNETRAVFGERRLQRTLSRAAGAGPGEIKHQILVAVEAFRGGVPPQDDEALVVVRVE